MKLVLLLILARYVCPLHHDFALLCRNLLFLNRQLVVDGRVLVDYLIGSVVLHNFSVDSSSRWLVVVVLS